mgnify:CR=1 FL=1|tara:strand:+ start:675 stop:1256 length:582 start_codon:yes stop_codon:yes gene_type:complete
MIRAELKFKNAAFINSLKQNGYKSIAEFARISGLCYGTLIEYANLKKVIKNVKQRQKMIELLDSDEWTLFLQYDELLEKEGVIKTIATDVPVNKFISLTSKEVLQLESNQNIEHTTDTESLKTDITKSLSNIQVRTKDVLEMFFGMGDYERNYSLEEIAIKYKVKRERVRQIKEKGIRQLRHDSRSKRLEKYT